MRFGTLIAFLISVSIIAFALPARAQDRLAQTLPDPVHGEGAVNSGEGVPSIPASEPEMRGAKDVAVETTSERDSAISSGDAIDATSAQSDFDPSKGEQSEPRMAEAYRLEIHRGENALEISGMVPGHAARNAVIGAASSAAPDLPKTIALIEEPEAPADFADAAVHGAGLLAFLAEGGVVLTDRKLTYSGTAYHARAKRALQTAARSGWPPGYAVDVSAVTVGPDGPSVSAAACEEAIEDIIRAHPIEFEAGRADVAGDSKSLVDRVAYAAARCPDALIAVAGHTDSDGADESNYRLSLDRARTVVDLLVADGIPEERFTALGYGESRPLQSNATLAGKARNRRIEFVLRD